MVNGFRMFLAAGILLAAVNEASAQGISFYSAYTRSGDADAVSAGGTLEFGSGRVRPTVGLNLFWASYPIGETDEDLSATGITPTVGLMFRPSEETFIATSVGYHFADEDVSPLLFVEGSGGGDGVVTNAMIGHYGLWPISLDAIGSYNWGSEYLWSRALATYRLASIGTMGLSVGGEFVYQGDMSLDDATSTSFGPLVRVSFPSNLSLGVGYGWRNFEGGDDTYFKVELGWFRNN